MNDAALPSLADTQINWLELARLAAQGEGHDELGRGIRRLATLAAAVHRQRVATLAAETVSGGGDSDQHPGRVHGWTRGEIQQDRQPGTEARR
ncbi:MAG: hypothetical protein AAF333_05615 [Planctomycetota bacterium]